MFDFELNDYGSIFILTPHTDAAKDWIAEHIPDDAQWFAGGVVVEHRYIGDIITGVMFDGLAVRGADIEPSC